jgi:hypothetical protein
MDAKIAIKEHTKALKPKGFKIRGFEIKTSWDSVPDFLIFQAILMDFSCVVISSHKVLFFKYLIFPCVKLDTTFFHPRVLRSKLSGIKFHIF